MVDTIEKKCFATHDLISQEPRKWMSPIGERRGTDRELAKRRLLAFQLEPQRAAMPPLQEPHKGTLYFGILFPHQL
jgi:hypothetical protein